MGAQLSVVRYYLPAFFSNEYRGSTHFNDLPEDLHILVFSILDIPTQIRIRAVCTVWRDQIEAAFFRPVRHLSLFIIDPASTPTLKPTNYNEKDPPNLKYEYYAGNEQFGARESSFLYVNDIAASLANPPTIEKIVNRNRVHGYKVHQVIPIDEGRLVSFPNTKFAKKEDTSVFITSFCRMLAGIFTKNNTNLETLSVYASRKHFPLGPSFVWGLDEWQHYKWSFTYSRSMVKKFQELEEAPFRPLDLLLEGVIWTLSDLRSIILNYDCSYIFQLSSMRAHIAALAEHKSLTELQLNFNLGDSRCLLYERNENNDSDYMSDHFNFFSLPSIYKKNDSKSGPQLFQKLIPNLEKLSLRGQFDDDELKCTLKAVSSKMRELKISRSVLGDVEDYNERAIQMLPVISTVKLACWSVYTQSDISKCVHFYPNAETLKLEICKKILQFILLNDLAKLENLNELAIISFEKLDMLKRNFSLPKLKKLYLLQPFNNNDLCRPANPLLHQYYFKPQTNFHNNQLIEEDDDPVEELTRVFLNVPPFIKMLKETFPNLQELYLAGYLHLAQYNTALLFEQLQMFIPSVNIYFRDIVTGQMVSPTSTSV